MPTYANKCQYMPTHAENANTCQQMSIHANKYQQLPTHANKCQQMRSFSVYLFSMTKLSYVDILFQKAHIVYKCFLVIVVQ